VASASLRGLLPQVIICSRDYDVMIRGVTRNGYSSTWSCLLRFLKNQPEIKKKVAQ